MQCVGGVGGPQSSQPSHSSHRRAFRARTREGRYLQLVNSTRVRARRYLPVAANADRCALSWSMSRVTSSAPGSPLTITR